MSLLKALLKILLVFVIIFATFTIEAYVLTYLPPYWCLIVFFLVLGFAGWGIHRVAFRDEE